LVNLLSTAGFTSVYECFIPAHIHSQPGLEPGDRCTFVAHKGNICELGTSPVTNGLRESWPEQSLTYAPNQQEV